jgi:hypothetical protein
VECIDAKLWRNYFAPADVFCFASIYEPILLSDENVRDVSRVEFVFFFLENGGVYNTYILHLLPLTCLYTHCIYSVFCPSYLLIDVVKSIHFHLPICALLLLHWAWCTRSPSLGTHQEDSAVSLEAEWFLMRAPSSVKQISVYTLHDRLWCMLRRSRTNMDM